jgi:hypothetical protein
LGVRKKGFDKMRRNVVLIDFESVQPDSIEALNHEHCRVLLFHGENQHKLSFEIAVALHTFGQRAQYIKISGIGPNALDFHIAYYIGRQAVEEPKAYFHIVSRDKGFDPLIRHLREHKILCARAESIAEIPFVKNGVRQTPDIFIATLKKPEVTKPQTEKAMRNAIRAHFRQTIEEPEIAQILHEMVATGFISIEAGKIVYAQFDANPSSLSR